MLRENVPSKLSKASIVVLILCFAASAVPNIVKGIAVEPKYFSIAIIGLVLFIVSKILVISKGRWVSFGSNYMSSGVANAYRSGYWLMVVGVVCTFSGP